MCKFPFACVFMLEEYGLSLNVQKTKVFSTEVATNGPCYCDTNFGMIDILSENQKHKYLGRMFSGNIRKRGKVATEFRVSCGWMKYHAFQNVFENKHISTKLRLKLFDSVITATILYFLETCPLTVHNFGSRLLRIARLLDW